MQNQASELLRQGNEYYDKGDYASALPFYMEAVNVYRSMDALYGVALCHWYLKDGVTACKFFQIYIQNNGSRKADALYFCGLACLKGYGGVRMSSETAAQYFAEAGEMGHAWAMVMFGSILQSLWSEYKKAEECITAGMAAAPNDQELQKTGQSLLRRNKTFRRINTLLDFI